eukprot:scaffold339581_cov18-Prasinocladus_malaysianus.AAC.1
MVAATAVFKADMREVLCAVEDKANGQYRIMAMADVPGEWHVRILVNGLPIQQVWHWPRLVAV